MSGDKLEGLKEAIKAYTLEQRRGTTNRVGVVTFSDDPYLAISLTNDYDAIIAYLKELETQGSTAVGKGMLRAISHFMELNAYQLDADQDPRVAEVHRLLDSEGLAAALQYAEKHPDLMKKIVRPEITKIAVIFTDGDSNAGITPRDAAGIANKLGIRIYTVGVGTSGNDENILKEVADITGGLYFNAKDAEGMKDALLDINRLEKSPALVKSQVVVKDFQQLLILLALLSLAGEVVLSTTKLRRFPAYLLMTSLTLGGVTGKPDAVLPTSGSP